MKRSLMPVTLTFTLNEALTAARDLAPHTELKLSPVFVTLPFTVNEALTGSRLS